MKTPACLSRYPVAGPSNDWSVETWEVSPGIFVCFDDSVCQWLAVNRDVFREDSTVLLGAFDNAESTLRFLGL